MYYQQRPQQAPLPPGWEAKWDPNNRKWFFVNHFTKKTQWTDPRIQPQQQQPRPTPSPAPAQVTPRPTPSPAPARVQPRPTPSPAPARPVQPLVEISPHMIDALVEKYQNVDAALARNVLVGSRGNRTTAEQQLRTMGYREKVIREPTPEPEPEEDEEEEELTDQEKKRRLADLKAKVPNKSEGMLKICLETLGWDVDLAQEVFAAEKSSSSGVDILSSSVVTDDYTRPTTTRRRSPTPEPDPVYSTSMTPVVFGAESSSSIPTFGESSSASAAQPSTSSSTANNAVKFTGSGSTAVKFSGSGSSVAAVKFGDSTASAAAHFGDSSAAAMPKTVEKRVRNPKPKSRPKAAPKAKYNRPAGEYKSANCTPATGPDPTLAKGADTTNLLATFVSRLGHDASLCAGPQQSNHNGPDPKLVKGPGGLDIGPSRA